MWRSLLLTVAILSLGVTTYYSPLRGLCLRWLLRARFYRVFTHTERLELEVAAASIVDEFRRAAHADALRSLSWLCSLKAQVTHMSAAPLPGYSLYGHPMVEPMAVSLTFADGTRLHLLPNDLSPFIVLSRAVEKGHAVTLTGCWAHAHSVRLVFATPAPLAASVNVVMSPGL